MINFQLVLS